MDLTCLPANKKLGGDDQIQTSFHFRWELWRPVDPPLSHISDLYYPWSPTEAIRAL